jgi:hypothetical protein
LEGEYDQCSSTEQLLYLHEQLRSIPTIGGSDGVLLSYFDVIKRISTGDSRLIIRDGCKKVMMTSTLLFMPFKVLIKIQVGNAFKIAELNRWHIIVSGADKINELRSAPDDVLSIDDASNEVSYPWFFCLALTYCRRFQVIAGDFTVGREIFADTYHIDVLRGSLTRNIGTLFSELHEEIEHQFASEIPLTKGSFPSAKE